jgi:PLP dependent protein
MKTIIKNNVEFLQNKIHSALDRAGRPHGDAKIIPITKMVGLEEIQVLYGLEFRELGENRPNVAIPKIQAMPDDIRWHMIGSVQRRKAKEVVQHFDRIDAVDRIELATELEKRCAEISKTVEILLQVNVSGEESKHGFSPKVLSDTLNAVQSFDHLTIGGLMTMAPAEESEKQIRGYFRELKHLADDNGLSVLSMGMTNDYEIAIEEGATEIRIGTALYKQAE